MKTTFLKAQMAGLVVLLTGNAIWTAVAEAGYFSGGNIWILWLFPPIAAFLSACIASHRKMLSGLLVAVYAAALDALWNIFHEEIGIPVDFWGLKGAVIVFEIMLLNNVIFCTIGAGLGYFATRNRQQPV